MLYGWRSSAILFLVWVSMACSAGAVMQQTPTEQPTLPAEKKPVIETASMRLASARNVFIVRTRGSDIPFAAIRSTVEGWGRFTLVETRDKADLVIEVASSGDSGVQVSSNSGVSPNSSQEQKSTSTRKDISATEIYMVVFDARNKRALWSGTESVRFAVKEKTKENNLVEAAERLAAKFHQRLEPAAAK
jgi:hypothetical protein